MVLKHLLILITIVFLALTCWSFIKPGTCVEDVDADANNIHIENSSKKSTTEDKSNKYL